MHAMNYHAIKIWLYLNKITLNEKSKKQDETYSTMSFRQIEMYKKIYCFVRTRANKKMNTDHVRGMGA